MLNNLLETWSRLYDTEQSVLIEAVDHLIVNLDLKNVAQKTLELATENLKQDPHVRQIIKPIYAKDNK